MYTGDRVTGMLDSCALTLVVHNYKPILAGGMYVWCTADTPTLTLFEIQIYSVVKTKMYYLLLY